ncbi:hypothetical protein BH20ACI3_BH20ACI3_30450 [soil metagenome]
MRHEIAAFSRQAYCSIGGLVSQIFFSNSSAGSEVGATHKRLRLLKGKGRTQLSSTMLGEILSNRLEHFFLFISKLRLGLRAESP